MELEWNARQRHAAGAHATCRAISAPLSDAGASALHAALHSVPPRLIQNEKNVFMVVALFFYKYKIQKILLKIFWFLSVVRKFS